MTQLAAIEAALPQTFYSDRPLAERVKRMVELWRYGVTELNQYAARELSTRATIEALVAFIAFIDAEPDLHAVFVTKDSAAYQNLKTLI